MIEVKEINQEEIIEKLIEADATNRSISIRTVKYYNTYYESIVAIKSNRVYIERPTWGNDDIKELQCVLFSDIREIKINEQR